jgi:4-aminobutyrate aminotransferase
LIADEVQTGFGRTGEAFWGIESYGVRPDAIVMAKGLGNGMAIGGVVARAEWVDALRANHISTFGGSPITTAYAVANLDYLRREDLQANAARMGKVLMDGLKPLESESRIVGEVRGKGLMVGVELVADRDTKEPAAATAGVVLERCREQGLLVGKGGLYANTLRLAPPLTVTEADVGQAVETIRAAVRAAEGS